MADPATLAGESGAATSSATPAANKGFLSGRVTQAQPADIAGSGIGADKSRPRRSSVAKQLSFPSASDDDSNATPRSRRRSRPPSTSNPASVANASVGCRDFGVSIPLGAVSKTASDRGSPDTPLMPSDSAMARKRRRVRTTSPVPAVASPTAPTGCLGLEPAGSIYLTTYATVSAEQRKTFRSDEWKNRPKAQDQMLAPGTPPVGIGGLLQLNDLVTWPLVRIGETFQILFKPVSGNGVWTGAGKATSEIEGERHSAIRLTNVGAQENERAKANAKVIRIENYFWDATLQQTRCLRCAALSPECKCPFSNDLLQTCLERPGERCEIAKAPGGMLGITIRIPRTRKPHRNSDSKDKPSNNWMKGLPKPPGGDIRTPKAMELRVVEETQTALGVRVNHTHKGYVRLAAKNGAIRLKQGLSPSPTLHTHPAANTAPSAARSAPQPPKAKRQMMTALSTPAASPCFPGSLASPAVQRSPFKLESLIVAAQIERQKEDDAL